MEWTEKVRLKALQMGLCECNKPYRKYYSAGKELKGVMCQKCNHFMTIPDFQEAIEEVFKLNPKNPSP